MYPELNGRTVLVTGGSRGIGAATAAAFAAEGARVWVVGRDRQALDDTVAGIEKDGGTASPLSPTSPR
jgi:3-oxoacyl-[acyl-carrier protein] reductase